MLNIAPQVLSGDPGQRMGAAGTTLSLGTPPTHSILDLLSSVSITALPLINDKSCHGASVRFSRTLVALSIAQLGDLATVAGVKAACERENEHP